MNDAPRVLLAGGGSGGSATPVLAVAERLSTLEPRLEMLLVGTAEGPERDLAAAAGLAFASVPAGKLRRYLSLQNLTDPLRIVLGLVVSMGLVRRFRPDVALGAGGFATVPPLAAAALLGVPVHIHQQDVVPGLANRLLLPLARQCSISLAASSAGFPHRRTVLVGNPVRPSILLGDPTRAAQRFGLEPGLPLVVVTGGGTGALLLNRLVAAAAPELTGHCQIVHLTGRGRAVPMEHPLPRYHQLEFITSEMADLLAAARLVISRAGMGSLSELAALGKASLVVPMPKSHQRANAQAFAALGAVLVCDQDTLTPRSLAEIALSLLRSPNRLAELERNIASALPFDATDRLAQLILDLVPRRDEAVAAGG